LNASEFIMPKRAAGKTQPVAEPDDHDIPDELVINVDTYDESEDSLDQYGDEEGADTGLTGAQHVSRA
jgi:hypothetical protein